MVLKIASLTLNSKLLQSRCKKEILKEKKNRKIEERKKERAILLKNTYTVLTECNILEQPTLQHF
jgi:hypothetical protein